MKLSPLKLVRCYFSKIQVEASPGGTPPGPAGVFTTKTDIVPCGDQPPTWQVTLTLRLGPKANSGPPPYTGVVQVVGIFQVDSGYAADNRAALVAANAPAVLFGMAREMLTNVTARGPYPAVCLPTVTFIDEVPKPEPSAAKPLPTSDHQDVPAGTKDNTAIKARRDTKTNSHEKTPVPPKGKNAARPSRPSCP